MTPLLRPIVARINGLTLEIKRTKANIKIEHTKKQYALSLLKAEARHTMLAYAFIRRVPYQVVESTCNERPLDFMIERVVKSIPTSRKRTTNHEGKVRHHYRAQNWDFHSETLSDEVRAWLNPPDTTEAIAVAEPVQSLVQATVDGIRSLLGLS